MKMETLCWRNWVVCSFIFSMLVNVVVTETEPACYSRYDYDHKLLKTLLTLEIKVEQLETIVKQQDTVIKQQETVIKQQGTTIETMNTKFEVLKSVSASDRLARLEISPDGQKNAIYIRWGRTSCPGNGTELVYEGYAAGSHYTQTGGPANYICLPKDPTWSLYENGIQGGGELYGGEYELGSRSNTYLGRALDQQNVPCAVCKSKRASVLMIPARNQCYDGWTLEYHGYLVSGHHSHAAASETVCLDGRAEVVDGGAADENGKLFFFVEARCGSLKCPPYVQGRELTCVVCSI